MKPEIRNRLRELLNEYQQVDSYVFGLAMLNPDGSVLGSTFPADFPVERLAALFIALHELANQQCDAFHVQDRAEQCLLRIEGGPSAYAGCLPWAYGLIIIATGPSPKLSGYFTGVNLQLIGQAIAAYMETGQEPAQISWKWGI